MKNKIEVVLLLFIVLGCGSFEQKEYTPIISDFYIGADLSYVNELEDNGVLYKKDSTKVDPFLLFADQGNNLVRVRLWNNPHWTEYSILSDVKKSIKRARDNNMAVLLDFHYSDEWADPAKQFKPEAWKGLTDDELLKAVYDFTHGVLKELYSDGLFPEMIQVGNETNQGMLLSSTKTDWQLQGRLFNSGIKAARDISEKIGYPLEIILHVAQPENCLWWFSNIVEHGVKDFDIIGLSYYPQWSNLSVQETGSVIGRLKREFQKDVMVVETGYPWTRESSGDSANNVITSGLPEFPVSVDGQNKFMKSLVQSIKSNGGLGVIYWEPAWVSSSAPTLWGIGSHWENASFFSFDNEFNKDIDFMSKEYISNSKLIDGVIEESYEPVSASETSGDGFKKHPQLDLDQLYIREDDESFYIALKIDFDISKKMWGFYDFYLDTKNSNGANSDIGRRPITFSDKNLPEYKISFNLEEFKGQEYLKSSVHRWSGNEWISDSFSGAMACKIEENSSVIEFQIIKEEVGYSEDIYLGLISSGKGPIQGAVDVYGAVFIPDNLVQPLILESFFKIIEKS